jgi:hypothetical protein
MVDKARVKIYAVGSRHSINLPAEFVRDSQFPFSAGEELIAKIEKGRIVIERALSK